MSSDFPSTLPIDGPSAASRAQEHRNLAEDFRQLSLDPQYAEVRERNEVLADCHAACADALEWLARVYDRDVMRRFTRAQDALHEYHGMGSSKVRP